MKDIALFFEADQETFLGGELEDILMDANNIQDFTKLKAKFEVSQREDLTFNYNERFWTPVFENRVYIDQYVTLYKFYLTEWLPPMALGLFFTPKVKLNRVEASKYLVRERLQGEGFPYLSDEEIGNFPICDSVSVELNPRGKMTMVLGN